MRQFHDDAAAEPKCANPLTAQDLRRERVKLAHELLVLIQEDIDSNAPGEWSSTSLPRRWAH